MIKSRRRWVLWVPLTKEECEKRGMIWEESLLISVSKLSMNEVKKFTTKEQRRRNYEPI